MNDYDRMLVEMQTVQGMSSDFFKEMMDRWIETVEKFHPKQIPHEVMDDADWKLTNDGWIHKNHMSYDDKPLTFD